MENQIKQQQKTHGKATKNIVNQVEKKENTTELLRHKAGTATSSPKTLMENSQISFHTWAFLQLF